MKLFLFAWALLMTIWLIRTSNAIKDNNSIITFNDKYYSCKEVKADYK